MSARKVLPGPLPEWYVIDANMEELTTSAWRMVKVFARTPEQAVEGGAPALAERWSYIPRHVAVLGPIRSGDPGVYHFERANWRRVDV